MANMRIVASIEPAGNFPVTFANYIEFTGGVRLDAVINQIKQQIENIDVDAYTKAEVDAMLSGKVDIQEGYGLLSDDRKRQIQTNTDEIEAIKSEIADIPSSGVVSQLRTDVDIQTARLNQIIDSVPPGTIDEVRDARVDSKGHAWDNLGDAIRGVSNDISQLNANIANVTGKSNVFTAWRKGSFAEGTSTSTRIAMVGKLLVSDTIKITASENYYFHLRIYDTIDADPENYIYDSRSALSEHTIPVQYDGKYFALNAQKGNGDELIDPSEGVNIAITKDVSNAVIPRINGQLTEVKSEIADNALAIESIKEKTYSLIDFKNVKWNLRGGCEASVDGYSVTVKATTNKTNCYAICYYPIRDMQKITISNVSHSGTGKEQRIRVGIASEDMAETFSWLGFATIDSYSTFDVSAGGYLVIGFYCASNVEASAGDYVTYDKVMVVEGTERKTFIPANSSIDYTARTLAEQSVQRVDTVVGRTYSLVSLAEAEWKSRSGGVMSSVSESEITVTATQAKTSAYTYAYFPTNGMSYITVSNISHSGTGLKPTIRVAGINNNTTTDWTWIGYVDLDRYASFDVSGYQYYVIAFYIASDVAATVGDYLTYSGVMVVEGTESKPYVPLYSAVDYIARANSGGSKSEAVFISPTVKSMGHRGMRYGYPENTQPALIYCRQAGFEYAENDILWTSDGEPVICHLTTLVDYGYPDVILEEKTLAELKTYELGTRWGMTGIHILTLEEWFIICKRLGLKAMCHNKENQLTDEHAEKVIAVARRTGMLRNTIWLQGDVTQIRKYDPKAKYRTLSAPTAANIQRYSEYILDSVDDSFGFNPEYNAEDLTEQNIHDALDAGFVVGCWADRRVPEISAELIALCEYGVTEFTTNNISVADVLKEF